MPKSIKNKILLAANAANCANGENVPPSSIIYKKEGQAMMNSLHKLRTIYHGGDDAKYIRDLLEQTITINDAIKNCLDCFVDSSDQTVNDFKGISEFISVQMLGESIRHTIVSSLKTVYVELYNELMEQAEQAQIEAKQRAQEARKKKVQTQDGAYTSNIFGDARQNANIAEVRAAIVKYKTYFQQSLKLQMPQETKEEVIELLNYLLNLSMYSDNELAKFNFNNLHVRIVAMRDKIDEIVSNSISNDDNDTAAAAAAAAPAAASTTTTASMFHRLLMVQAEYNMVLTPLKEMKQQIGQSFRWKNDLNGLISLRRACVRELKGLIKESMVFIKEIRSSISKEPKQKWKQIIAAYDIFAGKYNLIIPIINSFYDALRLKVKHDKLQKSKNDKKEMNPDYYLPDFSRYTFDDLPTTSSSYSRFKRMRYIGVAEQLEKSL